MGDRGNRCRRRNRRRRCRMGDRGRGPGRPAASTGNGLVTFRDADWKCACAYNVTRSLTGKDVYYDTRLNFTRFSIKVRFS